MTPVKVAPKFQRENLNPATTGGISDADSPGYRNHPGLAHIHHAQQKIALLDAVGIPLPGACVVIVPPAS